jgi:NADH dehydrogenase FAD-containing subunit
MSRCFPPPPPRREARLSGSEHLGEQAGGTHAEHDRAGRVKVRVDLSVPSHSDIFAVGDTAAVTDQPGIPGTAPRAKQMGRYVGRLIAAVGHGSPYGCYETFGRLADWRSPRLDVGHPDHPPRPGAEIVGAEVSSVDDLRT